MTNFDQIMAVQILDLLCSYVQQKVTFSLFKMP